MADDKERDPPAFGRVIRERRIELGLTQEELAERVGESVRQSDISRMEHDYVMLPRRDRLEALAAALDLSPGHLLMQSGWITSEESASLDHEATRRLTEPAAPDSSSSLPNQQTAPLPVGATPEPDEGKDTPETSTDLNVAIAHAREISLETGELLRRTASTMQNARRSRRSSR